MSVFVAPEGGHVEVAERPCSQEDVTRPFRPRERYLQPFPGLDQFTTPEQAETHHEERPGEVLLAAKLLRRGQGRALVGKDLVVDPVAGLAELLHHERVVESLLLAHASPGLDHRTRSLEDSHAQRRLVAPVVQLRAAVQLELQPEIHQRLVLASGVLTKKRFGGIEGGNCGVVAVGVYLHPSEADLETGGEQRLFRIHEI